MELASLTFNGVLWAMLIFCGAYFALLQVYPQATLHQRRALAIACAALGLLTGPTVGSWLSPGFSEQVASQVPPVTPPPPPPPSAAPAALASMDAMRWIFSVMAFVMVWLLGRRWFLPDRAFAVFLGAVASGVATFALAGDMTPVALGVWMALIFFALYLLRCWYMPF